MRHKEFGITRLYFRIFCVAVLLYAVFGSFTPAAHAQPNVRNVLVLNSYDKYAWTDDIWAGIQSVLGDGPNINIYVEYMGTKKICTEDYLQRLHELYSLKYKNISFDVIIPADDNAYQFMLKYHADLFKNAPAVFCGVNRFDPAQISGHPVTGVLENEAYEETLAIAFKLQPQTTKIYAICDHTVTAKINLERLKKILAAEYPQVRYETLCDLTVDEMSQALSTLPEDAIVLAICWWKDSTGRSIKLDEYEDILRHSNRPVFGFSTWQVGRGLTGGKCSTGFEQGRFAARMARQVLEGTDIRTLPVIDNPDKVSVYMFDYLELQRHHISRSLVPKDAIVLNAPINSYEVSRKVIWCLVGGIAGLLGLVVGLIVFISHHRAIHRVVEEKQQSLRNLIDSSPMGIYLFDLVDNDRLILKGSNEAASRIVEHDISSQVGKTVEVIYPGLAGTEMLRISRHIAREGGAYHDKNFMYEDERINGCFDLHVFQTSPGSIAVMFMDVTEHNRIQRQLEFTQFAVDHAGEAAYWIDKDGRLIYVNEAACKTLGYTRDELLKMSIPDLDPNFSGDSWAEYWAESKEKGSGRVETLHCAKDGRMIPVEVSVNFVTYGGVEYHCSFARDITDRKQAEKQLRESRKDLQKTNDLLRTIVEAAPVAIIGLDLDGKVRTVWNPAAEKMLGWTASEVMGKYLPTVPQDRDEEFRKFRDLIRSGKSLNGVDARRKRRDGTMIDYSIYASPLRGSEGRIIGNIAVLVDIADRKQNDAVNAMRLHLIQFSLTHSLDELLEETLNETERLTGSLIGFYHFVEEDQKALSLQNWSTRTKAKFCKAEGTGLHYPIDQAGVWVDCIHQRKAVIHNDYASLDHRKGMPEGHAKVIRELVVPVFRGEKITAILGIGNKSTNYTEKDVETVSLIADLVWEIAERKRAEQAEHESEQRYHVVFENSPVSIWEEDFSEVKAFFNDLESRGVTDLEAYFVENPEIIRRCAEMAKIVDMNRAALTLHGAESKEELMTGLGKLFTAESFETFRRELLCLWQGGIEMSADSVVKTLAGDLKNVTVNFSICPGYEQSLSKVVVTVADITERKQAEQQRLAHLHFVESMDKVNRAIQGAYDLEKMMSDVLDVVLSVFDSDRAYLIYPCDPEAATWNVQMERYRPEFPGVFAAGIEMPMTSQIAEINRKIIDSEHPIAYGVGTDLPMSEGIEDYSDQSGIGMALYPKGGKAWGFGVNQCSYARIWTEAEKLLLQEIGRRLTDGLSSLIAHRTLRESENKHRLIFTSASDAILIMDENGCCVECNPQAVKLFGCDDASELISKCPADFSPVFQEDGKQSFESVIEKCQLALQGQDQRFSWVHRKKDGSFIYVEVSLNAFELKGQRRIQAIIRDVTQQRLTKIRQEKLLRELQSKNEELESVVYIASHDLRSPLVNIRGFTGELEKSLNRLKKLLTEESLSDLARQELKTIFGEDVPESIGFIKSGNRKMDLLLNGLLRISRVGSAEIRPTQVDMNPFMEGIANNFLFRTRKEDIEIAIDQPLPACTTDPMLLNQVFTNLIDNAIKYRSSDRPAKIHISAETNDDAIVYCVRDNGIGIAREHIDKVFEIFHRLNPDSEQAGEGLGLTIVRRVLKRLDGHIWIESTLNVGTSVFIKLPKA